MFQPENSIWGKQNTYNVIYSNKNQSQGMVTAILSHQFVSRRAQEQLR